MKFLFRRKPHIIVFGPLPRREFMEGGMIRVQYINQAIVQLGFPVSYITPEEVGGMKVLLKGLLRRRLLPLLYFWRRRLLFSHGLPLQQKTLRRLAAIGVEPYYFDLHDDPRYQFVDLGINVDPTEIAARGAMLDLNLAAYTKIGLSSPDLKNFYSFPRSKYILAPNATDPANFPVKPLPKEPIVALVGSTSPGRGADLLIEACKLVRKRIPKLQLRLALSNISGLGNLPELKEVYGKHPWITFMSVDYRGIGDFLAGCKVCVIPHRQSRYADTVIPIKLFDYMAAGRPIVATPCNSYVKIIEQSQCGVLSGYDIESMAEKITKLVTDHEVATQMGEHGRKAVVTTYNWDQTAGILAKELIADLQ